MNTNYALTKRSGLVYSLKFWIMTLFLVLVYSSLLFAQNVVHVDPTNGGDPAQDGSFDHPYSVWSDVVIESNHTYLQKRGTTAEITAQILISDQDYVTIGAYGEGDKPVISKGGPATQAIRIDNGSKGTVIDGIYFYGDTDYSKMFGRAIYVECDIAGNGEWVESLTIKNCHIAYMDNALIIQKAQTGLDTLLVENCVIHDIKKEGLWGAVTNPTVRNCHLYNINMDWHFIGHSHNESGGDAIQFGPGNAGDIGGNVVIENNIVDRRSTGNKFCFIYASGGSQPGNREGVFNVYVRYNTFYAPKDTVDDGGGDALYIADADTLFVHGNYFSGKGYDAASKSQYACFVTLAVVDVRYNVFDNVEYWVNLNSNDQPSYYYNNTFVDVPAGASAMVKTYFIPPVVKGNIFAAETNVNFFTLANPVAPMTDTSNNLIIHGDSDTWQSRIGFVDWENENYTLMEDSPAHDGGFDYTGTHYDIDSIWAPQGLARDIGACELPEGGQSNLPPVIEDQSFSADENIAGSTVVGTVEATDPDAGQVLTFSIQSGNVGGAFAIGSTSGVITVANSAAVNFEENETFELEVEVQDNGAGSLSDEATVTITLNDVNEVPEIEDQTFAIEESIGNGDLVGMVEASDPDQGQSLAFSITAGNTDDAFQIDEESGELTVADNSVLNANVTPEYFLTVMVEDDGNGNLSNEATITVSLLEVNLAPSIEDQSFAIEENSANGQQVGVVLASDPNPGQSLTYSIVSGNSGNAFEIGAASGIVTVANVDMINFEVNPVFILTVEVEDDGAIIMTDDASVTINVNDVNEPPVMDDQNFIVEETISNGDLVGFVEAEDPDQGQTLTYSITDGNQDGAFEIDATSGELTVVDDNSLNWTQNPIYYLDVEVEDDGTGQLTDQAVVSVSVDEVNQAPNIENQMFSVEENSTYGTEVGDVIASDPDAGQSLTYSILSGNYNSAFQIDAQSGTLSVNVSSSLNYEEHDEIELVIEVQDDGIGTLTDEATVTVHLIDVNEAPVVESQTFGIDENSALGMTVGTVQAEDPDAGQSLSYAIISGNLEGAFGIDETSGSITVNNELAINFESYPVYYLVVEVEDDGAGNLSGQAVMTINLADINETPVIEDQYFNVEESSNVGTFVGEVVAEDPDNGQTLTYTILSGNIQDAFSIDPSSGEITVQNSAALNSNVNPVFILQVEVEDNGQGNLSDEASVVIALEGTTGIGDDIASDPFACSIYPNPASDEVNLDFTNLSKEELSVTVVNAQGQVMLQQEFQGYGSGHEEKINIAHWNEGVYIVVIKHGDMLERKKIVKN